MPTQTTFLPSPEIAAWQGGPKLVHNGTETSKAAAESMVGAAEIQLRRILEFIRSKGEYGATRDEIVAALGIDIPSVCGRCDNLLRMKLIYETDVKRKTRKGRFAFVLRAK